MSQRQLQSFCALSCISLFTIAFSEFICKLPNLFCSHTDQSAFFPLPFRLPLCIQHPVYFKNHTLPHPCVPDHLFWLASWCPTHILSFLYSIDPKYTKHYPQQSGDAMQSDREKPWPEDLLVHFCEQIHSGLRKMMEIDNKPILRPNTAPRVVPGQGTPARTFSRTVAPAVSTKQSSQTSSRSSASRTPTQTLMTPAKKVRQDVKTPKTTVSWVVYTYPALFLSRSVTPSWYPPTLSLSLSLCRSL